MKPAIHRIGDLAITPTRLQLLRDVGDGYVWLGGESESWLVLDETEQIPPRKVTAEMAVLKKAGAVRVGGLVKNPGRRPGIAWPWLLTEVAQALLAEVDGDT